MKLKSLASVFLLMFFFVTGCVNIQKSPVYPAHDEVLLYELPYDLTYLRTLDALSNLPGWELDITEKEKGTIRVRNLNWTRLDDSDRRLVTFVISRVSRTETSVQIAPESQRTLGGGDLMKHINKYVSAEL